MGDRSIPRIRSALFVPAQRADFLEKADLRDADSVILDLEDAVAGPGKLTARSNAHEWLRARPSGQRPAVMARVNAIGEGAIEEDLEAVVHPGLLAVLIPKLRNAEEVVRVAELLSWFEGRRGMTRGTIRIWPIIETAEAVREAYAIATASDRVEFMGGGTSEQGDLARDVGFEWSVDGLETLYIRSHVLIASRAARIENPMSGLVSGLADLEEVRAFALGARRLGYAGMMVIHPAHVAVVNDVFTPSVERVSDARRIIEALDDRAATGVGAVEHEGRMIDRAMARTAERLVADAERLGVDGSIDRERGTDVTPPDAEQIFEGLRVVDLTTGMAGPLASMTLADHGADVVKVEPPGGEWARALPAFVQWNRGKRGIECDLGSLADRATLHELVSTADVIMASDAVHVLDRIGLTTDRMDLSNPGLITCSISGFGDHPVAGSPRSYEGVVAALTGRMSDVTQLSGGHPGKRYDGPVFTAAPVASFGASQLALQGILAVLLQRRRTGRGQHVETSLLQGAVAFVMRQELGRAPSGSSQSIPAAMHRGIELCFLTAECADGRYIQMCARQDRHFQNWLRAVGLADLLDDPRYRSAPMGIPTVEDVDDLEARLRQRMSTRTQAEWMRIFTDEHDVGADPFLTPREFLELPDMVANERVIEIEDPVLGTVRQLGPLVQMDATPARIDRSAPAVGESNEQLRSGEAWSRPQEVLPDPVDASIDVGPPLAGTTILEVAYYIAGPMATTLLSELGARVIKVEPREGDPYRRTGLQSAKFLHGKESITLDLKSVEGRDVLERLIDRSAVVVHSFRSAPALKLGLDAPSVLARNPGVVHLYAASYGSRGPQRDRAAFHSTPNALTGGGVKQAGAGNPPVNDSYADPGGALGAATAILLGLWARDRTGTGQSLETTMLVSTGYIHSADMVVFDGVGEPAVADGEQRGLCARYRLYACTDGHIFVAAVQPSEWRALLAALALPELEAQPEQVIASTLEECFGEDTCTRWIELLGRAGVGVARAHPEGFDRWLEAEGLLLEAEHPSFGPYWRLPAKVGVSASRPVIRPACATGEHSVALLEELGYDAGAVGELLDGARTSDGRSAPAPRTIDLPTIA